MEAALFITPPKEKSIPLSVRTELCSIIIRALQFSLIALKLQIDKKLLEYTDNGTNNILLCYDMEGRLFSRFWQ